MMLTADEETVRALVPVFAAISYRRLKDSGIFGLSSIEVRRLGDSPGCTKRDASVGESYSMLVYRDEAYEASGLTRY